ncbi:MAG: isocitrate/isopropylmalate dehydrogenase family protein [Chrysiogenetes bacterium]|nr:isocitrate/isopropylmalate dehydrogenase family protein [Chrysiogenetes bacterium]
MAHHVVLIPGDGIGPEISEAMTAVIEALDVAIEWEEVLAGEQVAEKYGTLMPKYVGDAITNAKVAIKGPITTPVGKGLPSANVTLRKMLDLYANLRPVLKLPGIQTPYPDVDLILVRENTEDLYSGIEHVIAPGVVESIKVITEKASTRIARFAFEQARSGGRKKVTAVHKANIMKLSDGLFLDCIRKVAADYSEIEYEEALVDNVCMSIVANPGRYDVLLMENLFGDILSDLTAGLVGGLGVCPGANIGLNAAVFEPVHGSAPDIAGKGIANPTAMLLSAAMMLDHLEERQAASRLREGLKKVYEGEPAKLTGDLGGKAGTKDFTEHLIASL